MKNNNFFKSFQIAILIFLALSLSACGKKENTLYHTWAGEQYSKKVELTFYEDGSGMRKEEDSDGDKYHEKFSWKAHKNGILEIITGDNFWDFDLESFSYSISKNGQTLTLEDENSSDIWTMTRVKQ